MPPLPSVPNVVRIKHTFTDATDLSAQTRMHFGYTGGPPTNADALALATAIHAAFVTDMQGLMADDLGLTALEVLDLSSPSGGVGVDITLSQGTRGLDYLSAGTAVLVQMRIARRYRGGKPRMYWPIGVSTDLASATAWQAGSQAAFLTGFNNYQIAVGGLTSGTTVLTDLKNVSYYEGFTSVLNPITGRTKDVAKLRVGGPVVDTVTSLNVDLRPASQRRRNQQGT